MKSLFYKIFLVPVFCVSVHGQSHENSPWHIIAKNIDTNNYYGITVANGVVGMVSSPQPLKVEEVILNGVQQLKTSLPKNWKSLRLTGIGKEESTFIVKQ